MVLKLEEQTLPITVDLATEGDKLLYIVTKSDASKALTLKFLTSQKQINVNMSEGFYKEILDLDLTIEGSQVEISSVDTFTKTTISLRTIKTNR